MLLCKHLRNSTSHSAGDLMLFYGNDAFGLARELYNCFAVDRLDRRKIHHTRFDTLALQLLRRHEGLIYQRTSGNDAPLRLTLPAVHYLRLTDLKWRVFG